MAVYLVCEGENTGLDNRVLDRLVIQFYHLPAQVVPSGGSGGLGAVRTYLTNRSPRDVAISIEDRDYYRTLAQANTGWADVTATRYTWRRHEIENYLLQPRVVLALFDKYRVAMLPWALALPNTEDTVFDLLRTVAIPLLENHAAEVLRVELLRLATSHGSLQFGAIRPPVPPDAIVAGRADWIPALQQEAGRLCRVCSVAATLPQLHPAAISTRYHDLLAQLQAPPFLAAEDFLIDMGGHELMAALAAHLRTLGAPAGFTVSFLEEELLQTLAPIYRPAAIYHPDDFQDLATILRQY